ncbi:SDR family oxidoreductase [uncultured Lacinutrix sp.]|uniref:SDR family oxidoreductase n=1 Tax=uncultured Lacinutrix sp. TaxID=574032 RepID=UPI002628F621|nr:NmrA family NAD(P)-binding protein [uncultured Lacinutrix sp.]
MKVFVSNASGFQGGNIAGQLLAKKHTVNTLKRSLNEGVSVMAGVNVFEGGLDNNKALNDALKTVDVAVYSFPLIFDIALAKTYTANFIAAAKAQNVALIIYNVGFHLVEEETNMLAFNLKLDIKKLFDASGLNVITLSPDIYIDNLAAPWSIPVILNNNILPYPVASHTKFPWISHFDLAKYVVAAVSKPELTGQTLPIGGNLFTGEAIAEAIATKIKRPVSFVAMTPNDFEQQLAPAFGALAAKEISNLYRYVDNNKETLTTKDFKKTQYLLGVEPQSLNAWVDSVNWDVNV